MSNKTKTQTIVLDEVADWDAWSSSNRGKVLSDEQRLGVEEARSVGKLEADLAGLLTGASQVFFRLGSGSRAEGPVIDALRIARTMGVRKGSGPHGVMDPGTILNELRVFKDEHEVEAIRKAARLSVQGFLAGIASVRPDIGEWEVEAVIEGTFRRLGADGAAFPSIVGSGANGCILHYIQNASVMRNGDLVLIDAGAEKQMYSGDLSRTVPVSGRFSEVQRQVYDVVDAARREAIARVAPGVGLDEVHGRVVRILVEGLTELGVLSGDVDELISTGAHERYFPHRTSHWLGLDTHDVGAYSVDGSPRQLESGMVLTVEPGLYFAPGTEPEALGGIGVRIEDDVLVTENGAEVLNPGLPTSSDEIERFMEGQLVGIDAE